MGAPLASSGGSGGSSRARQHPATKAPTVPPLVDPHNVYAADSPTNFSPVVRRDPALVYVPNSLNGTVDVIDQQTLRIVGHVPVKTRPQHVVPSYDLRTSTLPATLATAFSRSILLPGGPAVAQSRLQIPITSISRRTVAMPSPWQSCSSAWTFATLTRWRCGSRCPCQPAPVGPRRLLRRWTLHASELRVPGGDD